MWFSLLYRVAYSVAFLAFLPRIVYCMIARKKYRTSFLRRFGFFLPAHKKNMSHPVVLVHAPSVGETQAVSTLVKRIKEHNPTSTIVVSSITETGHAEAKRVLPMADYHLFLPFDFGFAVKRVLNSFLPDILVIAESDIWYRFLREAKKRGAIAVVANGKISEKSLKRFKSVPIIANQLFSLIDFFCAQNDIYKSRYLELNIPASKIAVTGNIKVDATIPTHKAVELDEIKNKLRIQEGETVIVIGSSHDTEEALFLDTLKPLFERYAALKVVIAPRHPERFAQVQNLLNDYKLPYALWNGESGHDNPRLLLLNAIGILRTSYALADIAIVAGSFTAKVGGHNILEPASLGVPTVCGPHMFSQPEMIEIARQHNAVIQVTAEALGPMLDRLISDQTLRRQVGGNGLALCDSIRGATDKTYNSIRALAPELIA